MLYTLIIVGILIVALIAGMYFSSYQNINEKLALKKKYLRSQSILFKGPKIKSRISHSFGTIACLLLIFMVFNDPSVNVPFKRIASANMFNETIDSLISADEPMFFKEALDIAKEVNPKSSQDQKVVSDSKYFYVLNQGNLIKINKDLLLDSEHNEIKINGNNYQYDTSFIEMKGIINYQNKIITYGNVVSDNHFSESIIYIHNKHDLELTKLIRVKGKIEYINIQRHSLQLITANEMIKNEDYVGKIFAIKFSGDEKYQKTEYKNIFYIPENNIKYVLGIAKINLKNYKYTLNSLLVSDYFLASNNQHAHISVNIEPQVKPNSDASYVIQYDFYKMKITNSNKISGRIYNNFIFSENGNFIVTTITNRDHQNHYNIYTYDRLFYLKTLQTKASNEKDILVQKDDYFYLVNIDEKLIYLTNDEQTGFEIIPDEITSSEVNDFKKVLYNKIVNFTADNKKIKIKEYDPGNRRTLNKIEIDIDKEQINRITFDNYTYQGKKFNFLNIRTMYEKQYKYYIIPYIDDKLYVEYQIIIESAISSDYISHFYIDDYFIVFCKDNVLLYHNENLDSRIKIIIE